MRIMAHLKTFAKWVHTLRPFPLGPPMAKLKLPAVGTGLEIDRALTPAERRKVLDAADLLLVVGGRSIDRKRYKTGERPTRAEPGAIGSARGQRYLERGVPYHAGPGAHTA